MDSIRISLDRASGAPLAEQLAGQLLRAILEGGLPEGGKLPPERELADRLGVARGTVKRAYARLAQDGVIRMRQGSGSYVEKNPRMLEEDQKKQAAALVADTFSRLDELGLSAREALNLFNLHYLGLAGEGLRKVSVMVVSNNHDILSQLERQLAYLTETSPVLFTLSFLTLPTVQNSPDPVEMLYGYDLIIATSIDYPAVLALTPMYAGKLLEARLSPRTRTLMELSALPTEAKVRVVYRTAVFRDLVCRCLGTLGFRESNILPCRDTAYDPIGHDDDGVAAVVNHNESPVYDPAFRERNEAFTAAGGRIVRFEYRLERGSLLEIEDRIQEILRESKG